MIVDIYENSVYDIQQELKKKYPELDLVVLIASVRNTNRMNYIFSQYRPHILDQILRQRQNLHRFSHIQHEDLTALSVSPRLQDQRNSLRLLTSITIRNLWRCVSGTCSAATAA